MFDGKYLDWNQKKVKGIIDHYGHAFMQGKKVLDLGCGYGDIGGALYRLGADVTALDARQDNLKIVSKKFPGIKTIKADLDRSWPFPGNKFDLILDLDVVPYLLDYESHLRAVCGSTSHLVLELTVCDSPDENKSIQVIEGKAAHDMSFNGHGCRPTTAAVERVLKSCGFVFKRIDHPRFNSGPYIYDWFPKHDESYNTNNRRIWFATKTTHVHQSPFVPPLSPTTQSLVPNQIPRHNPRLATPPGPPPAIPNLKAALCISGHLRTFLDNYKSVKENILDRLNCDVFIHTWETLGMSYRFTDGNLHFTETRNLVERIHQLYKPKQIVIEKTKNFTITPLMRQRLIDGRDIPGIIGMYYKIEQCNNLKREYEQNGGFIYDCVIRFRGDLWVEQPIPINDSTNLHHVFLPMYGNFGGACDQFAFGSSAMMDKYSSLYSNLDNLMRAGAPMHPERLLQFHLDQQKVPIAKIHYKYVIKRANGLIQDNMLLERALGIRK